MELHWEEKEQLAQPPYVDHEGNTWPQSIEVNGKTLWLRLVDFQTGDCVAPHKAKTMWRADSMKWLEIIYEL